MSKLFSKENREVFTAPLNLDNPIAVQVLGICSALAVTSQMQPAIVMGLSVAVITAFSNLIISLIRKTIPNRIRIIVQLVVVAALVTIVSMVLKAFAYDVSVQLSERFGLCACARRGGHGARVFGQRLLAGLPGHSAEFLRHGLHEQRHDDDAGHGADSSGLRDLGTQGL